MTLQPKFDLSISPEVWRAVAEATSREFADSYLYGARAESGVLEPRTVIAFDALRRERRAVEALGQHRLVLKRPAPWFDGNGKWTAAEAGARPSGSRR